MKLFAVALAALAPLLLSGSPAPDRCRALVALSMPTLAIDATPVGAFCRALLVAHPRPGARIGIQLWLPPPRQWNGRYYQMGNGGFAGHVDEATLQAAAQRGDAAAATDTGHRGDGFDARWMAGRPDLVADYADRSIKVTADAARRLVTAYYGRGPRRRYFMGCSYGGRQALVAAARWPADWDGVIAGAPAATWPEPLIGFARIAQALRRPGASIAPQRLPALIAAARSRCNIDSPLGCGAAAVARRCALGERDLCLSAPQRNALSTIEAAGYPLAEADGEEWRQWILQPNPATGSQLAFAEQGFRYLFEMGERWTVDDFDPRFEIPDATRRRFAVGSLAAFERRGGRVISYFGLADPVLPPAFARRNARDVGARADAYRLFLIPGMAHCQGGPSAARFGQSLAAPAPRDDAEHDIRRSLEQWVEYAHGHCQTNVAAAGERC